MAIGPNELNNIRTDDLVKELIEKIDAQLMDYAVVDGFNWKYIIVSPEYPVDVRNKVAREYIKAGWFRVYHHTTTENGERAGLTAFALLTEKTEPLFNRAYKDSYKKKYWRIGRNYVVYEPTDIVGV